MDNRNTNMTNNHEKFSLRNASWLILIGIILLAFGLRVWGVNFGLPYTYHFDETTYTGAALNLGRGQIGPQSNPTGYTNLLFVEYIIYFVLGNLLKLFSSSGEFANLYHTDPSSFLILARLTSIILGTLTVLIVYFIGKYLHSKIAGLASALLLAIAFIHVRDSHYGVPDIAVTFFISASILFLLLLIKQNKPLYGYLAALLAGYAIATKWTAAVIIIPLILTIVFEHLSIKKILILLGSFFTGFLLGGFQLILKPSIYITSGLNELRAGGEGNFWFWQIDTLPGWFFYLKMMVFGLGILLTCAGLAGIVYYSWLSISKKNHAGIIVLSFPILYFLIMGISRHYFLRYALPLIPFVTLFAGIFLVVIYEWFSIKNRRLALIVVSTFYFLMIIFPFASSLRSDIILTKTDTRTVAKEWIENNIPAGSKIAVDWPIHTPPLSTSTQAVPLSKNNYDVTNFFNGTGLSDNPIGWYKENNFQYLIASSFIYDIPLANTLKSVQRQEFYHNLDSDLSLVKVFYPSDSAVEPPFIFDEIYGPIVSLWQRDQPGPVIKIYAVK
jgi:hypothetical protein